MAVNKIDYGINRSEDTNRGHSPTIWGSCPLNELMEDPRRGFYYRDDFLQTALLTTPTITTQAYYNNGWKAFGSSGGTLLGGFIEGGMGLVSTETDDNEAVHYATLGLPFKISRANGDFWYETRLKTSTITDLDSGIFFGLVEQQTLSAIIPIVAAGTMADANFVGFHRLEGDGDQVDVIYKANGVTQVSLMTDAMANLPTSTALVADTFYKFGFTYKKNGPDGSFKMAFYINGYKLPTTYTLASADGTDFPNDVKMGLCFAMLCGSSNDSVLTVDWVEAVQLAADTGAAS